MSQTILVTGATGKTGRRLLPMLASAGASTRPTSRTERTGHVLFDWAKPDSWQQPLSGASAIYLVGPDLIEDPSQQVAEFLELARRLGVEKVVGLSSLGVTFPDEPAQSGRLKVEAAIEHCGLQWTILRPSGFYQNFTEGFFAPGVAAGHVQTATASGKAAFIDAEDISAVAAAALTHPGHQSQIYTLTGPEPLSIEDCLAILGPELNREITYSTLTEDEFRSMMLGFGLPADFADVVTRDQSAIRNGHAATVTDSVEKISGRRATSFAQFVQASLARNQGT